MNTIRRNINPVERKKLEKGILNIEESLGTRINGLVVFILTGITIASAVHIYYFDKSHWSLISKLSVCVAPIGIWVLIEQYFKQKKIWREELKSLFEIRTQSHISVFPIDLNRIAKLKGDEDDLYLIETKDKKCVYLWDDEYLLLEDKDFPSEQMEVYVDDTFKYVLNKKVKCFGSKVLPILVEAKKQEPFYEKMGFPEDLQIETRTFDSIIEAINLASPIK